MDQQDSQITHKTMRQIIQKNENIQEREPHTKI